MIRFQCKYCGAKIKTDDSMAGKAGKCPRCQQYSLVPGAAPPSQPSQAMMATPAGQSQVFQQPQHVNATPVMQQPGPMMQPPAMYGPQQAGYTQMPQQVPVIQQNVQVIVDRPRKKWSPATAALLSFLIPGLGQIYKGQPLNGIAWFAVVIAGYVFLVVPGLILHVCCILGAMMGDPYR